MNMRAKRVLSLLAVAVGTVSLVCPQQVPDARRLVENYGQLRQYSWTMRTEVWIQEHQQSVTLEKMRYDLDGNLQATPVGGSGQLASDVQPVIDALAQVGFSYAQPTPEEAQAFLQKASIWEGRSPPENQGVLRTEGSGLIQPGDSVELRARNGRPERLDAKAIYQGSPVPVEADFRGLPGNGPNYVARLIVSLPAQQMVLIIENFDYHLEAPVAASDVGILSEGTVLGVRLTKPLSSAKNKAGEAFEAILEQDLVVHGRSVAPKGSHVEGQLVAVEASGRVSGRAKMSLKLTALSVGSRSYAIETNTLSFEAEGSKRRDARRIGGATGIGALIGGIADGGEGAAKGAVIGAGVAVGATLLTKGNEVEFPVEQLFSFSLAKPVEIVGG